MLKKNKYLPIVIVVICTIVFTIIFKETIEASVITKTDNFSVVKNLKVDVDNIEISIARSDIDEIRVSHTYDENSKAEEVLYGIKDETLKITQYRTEKKEGKVNGKMQIIIPFTFEIDNLEITGKNLDININNVEIPEVKAEVNKLKFIMYNSNIRSLDLKADTLVITEEDNSISENKVETNYINSVVRRNTIGTSEVQAQYGYYESDSNQFDQLSFPSSTNLKVQLELYRDGEYKIKSSEEIENQEYKESSEETASIIDLGDANLLELEFVESEE